MSMINILINILMIFLIIVSHLYPHYYYWNLYIDVENPPFVSRSLPPNGTLWHYGFSTSFCMFAQGKSH